MDFIIGLPPIKIKTKEVTDAILVIINRHIKFLRYFTVIIIIIAVKLADLFFRTVALIQYTKGNYI
jgi:hypothetical protein